MAATGSNFEKDYLIALYEQAHENRRDYVERMWGTVKYFTTTLTTLLAVTLASFALLIQNLDKLSQVAYWFVLFGIVLLSSVGIAISLIGHRNLERECRLEFMQMAIILTIEKIMGLQKEVAEDKRFFAQDKFIISNLVFHPKQSLPEGNIDNIKTHSSDDFVDIMLGKRHGLYSYFKWIFRAFTSLFVVFVMLSVGLSVSILYVDLGSVNIRL